jgi:hypothetical protein
MSLLLCCTTLPIKCLHSTVRQIVDSQVLTQVSVEECHGKSCWNDESCCSVVLLRNMWNSEAAMQLFTEVLF